MWGHAEFSFVEHGAIGLTPPQADVTIRDKGGSSWLLTPLPPPGELAGLEEMLDPCKARLEVARVGNTRSRV